MQFDQLKRRQFITLLGGVAGAWPLAARAQQAGMPMIGFLGTASQEAFADRLRAFRQGLSEVGYVEGRNVAIEYRWAEGNYDRMPALVTDLVRRRVKVIANIGGPRGSLAAKAETSTIPNVFYLGIDPVALGLVASLNRPGGNFTGVTGLSVGLGQKRLELLHEIVPSATVISLLVNPTNPTIAPITKDAHEAARIIGLQLHVLQASTENDIDAVFTTMVQLRAGGLVISPDAFFESRSKQLAELTVRHAIPAVYEYRTFVTSGGLMSYGASLTSGHRLVGAYVGRILNGEKPGDLPVIQATNVELFINLKTAKALGLAVPLSLLGRADEVIE